jgi:hypothetical protein
VVALVIGRLAAVISITAATTSSMSTTKMIRFIALFPPLRRCIAACSDDDARYRQQHRDTGE